MGKIFYLMGKSSSGKDTIYKELLKNEELGLKNITLYTTRPIRAGETEGVQYHFVDDEKCVELERKGQVIELREYQTVYGPWKYFTVDDGSLDLEKNDYIIIGTIESYVKTKAYFGENFVKPVLIELDDGIRLQRALNRERNEVNPKYKEMCRRFIADSEDFSEEKIKEAGISIRFINEDLASCLSEIESYIKG